MDDQPPMTAKLVNWNTAGPLFMATCAVCGDRVRGIDLLAHDCGPKSAEFWRARFLIERRYARRISWLLAASILACALLGWLR
jgi:hypothetical protein